MKYHAINPYFVSIVPFGLFLIAFFYPNDAWYKIFEEENKTYLNLEVILYILVCLFSLYSGMWIISLKKFFKKSVIVTSHINLKIRLVPVLIVTIIVLSLYIIYLIYNFPGFIFLTITGQGSIAKSMIASDEVDFGTLVNFAIPIIWWVWSQYYQASKLFKVSNYLYLLILIASFLTVYIIVINAARFAFIPLIIGWFIIYAKLIIFDKLPTKKHKYKSLKLFSILLIGILIVFSLFAISRGVENFEELFSMILGYGPVSYNRLTYVLDGTLTFEYSKTLVYIIPEPFFSLLYYIGDIKMVSGYEVWLSEFDGIEDAGINEHFIWLTVFGYVHDSIGYLSIIYFFFYGIAIGLFWQAFLAGKTFGIIMYPLIYFSVFFFFGSNYFIIFFIYYIFIYIILQLWEFLILMIVNKPRNRYEK